jgi:pimeloyl-ACP methyl ester carboxylesterase/DNA-binding CsgD family transcriptional regulator
MPAAVWDNRPASNMTARHQQTIRYIRTSDGVRLAWAESGQGPPLVKAANWISHLEYDLESPVWQHWVGFFSDHFRMIRYDERGCGLSSGRDADLSLERRVEDLRELITAADPREPVTLLGISQGASTCISYAVKYPDQVARLILYGGFAKGFAHVRDEAAKTEWRAILDLARVSWAKDNPVFRSVFTSQFIPDGSDEQLRWFNELCRRAASGPTAARILDAFSEVNVTGLLPQLRVPTIVMHARSDLVVPVESGRRIAASIKDAQFVELDSKNHVILRDERAWKRFCDAILRFTGRDSQQGDDSAFSTLSPRQREILSLLLEGLGNAAIAERLEISEKTVRNQLSTLFDRLGVSTRTQAVVFARDRGFRG